MISLEKVSLRAGDFALDDISFAVPDRQYGVLMGRTASGKTTILESICGLKPIKAGIISIDGRNITRLKPAERGIGFVPQDGALFPTMTIYEHLALALVVRKWKRHDIKERVHEMADLLGIGHLLKRKPIGLSGGERQRVALGRALSFRPHILCLDEPLSALDEDTRHEMCELLYRVTRSTHVTTLHVTHNFSEARELAHCLFHIEDGKIQAQSYRLSQ